MIIAAYAGCGKTTLANMYPNCFTEVPSMPYARILPYVKGCFISEFEAEKAAPYHITNPLFPLNMVSEILEAERESQYVVIPTISEVISILQNEFGRDVILCYPADGLEEEYKRRYLDRGNTEKFCRIFAERDRKSTRLNSSHKRLSRMPSSA